MLTSPSHLSPANRAFIQAYLSLMMYCSDPGRDKTPCWQRLPLARLSELILAARVSLLNKVPNFVGGINTECIKIVIIFYWMVIESIVSSRMAEAVKMLENIF